jgi:type I restriction enzyme M protein
MTSEAHAQFANFTWSICNLLRGPYKRNEYCKLILPLTVLRHFDCLLAPTMVTRTDRIPVMIKGLTA